MSVSKLLNRQSKIVYYRVGCVSDSVTHQTQDQRCVTAKPNTPYAFIKLTREQQLDVIKRTFHDRF